MSDYAEPLSAHRSPDPLVQAWRDWQDTGAFRGETRLVIVVPGRPSSPNRRNNSHWGPEARERRELRAVSAQYARHAVAQSGRSDDLPLPRVVLELDFGLAAVRGDLDNLVAGSKPIIDGLVDAGLLANDSIRVVREMRVRWHPSPVAEVRILVEEQR